MRRRWIASLAAGWLLIPQLLCPSTLAQDPNNPEALRKDLADTMAQLKAAQDRKNELASENEKLQAQLAALQQQFDELQRTSMTWSAQTYAVRAENAAWRAFVEHDPNLKTRWEVFLETAPPDLPRKLSEWPLGMPVPASLRVRPTATNPTEDTPPVRPPDSQTNVR